MKKFRVYYRINVFYTKENYREERGEVRYEDCTAENEDSAAMMVHFKIEKDWKPTKTKVFDVEIGNIEEV